MQILLIGEFSRLHNSLKEGLQELGHDVVLVGNGDLFKQFPADIDLSIKISNQPVLLFFRKVIHKVTNFDIADFEVAYKFKKALKKLHNFDVVQLINEDALSIHPTIQTPLLKTLIKQNKHLFLLSCGDDYVTINHYLKEKEAYSVLSPYLNNKSLKKQFHYCLKYVTPAYKKLHSFIYKHSCGVIASDIDYHIPLRNNEAYLGMIPNPINTDKILFEPLQIKDKIHIFHGINTLSKIKKGNDFFDEALEIIQKKYPDKVAIHTTYNLPYKEYINVYNQAHVVLDQVYSFDQGYNALEAMAKGKVVFTGAEKAWLDYYQLEENTVAINALPNVSQIVENLERLIENPNKLIEISKNARAFIEKEHHYIQTATKYLHLWKKHSNR
ncbi:glycosyltransferase [Xanthomarina sp. GH4-25]|uniref:glycosyltransferase family protein n=1 Tax=Xanthomarina sp. GH4-25 TaxID=3349335 RepID=UPI0014033533